MITGDATENLTTVLGTLLRLPSVLVSKYSLHGAKLLTLRSQISIRPSLATEAKTEEVLGDQQISLTCY